MARRERIELRKSHRLARELQRVSRRLDQLESQLEFLSDVLDDGSTPRPEIPTITTRFRPFQPPKAWTPERLRALRRQGGWDTLTQAADNLGTSKQTWSKWEKGRLPGPKYTRKLNDLAARMGFIG